MKPALEEIKIRNDLRPGDIGYIINLHGILYAREYGYSVAFESYVARGFHEFQQQYDPAKDKLWICEWRDQIIGFILAMHREKYSAQLRYFIVHPSCRGLGLGNRLMTLYMEFMKEAGYRHSFLWTTHELAAAASLYRKFGFRLTEEVPSLAFGKDLREQRYDWEGS